MLYFYENYLVKFILAHLNNLYRVIYHYTQPGCSIAADRTWLKYDF